MVNNRANGIARKMSPTGISQKWTNQPLSDIVGMKDTLVGRVSSEICFILPMWTKPVKKTTVRGVP